VTPPTGALRAEEPSAQWDILLRQEIEKTPDLVKRFVLTLRASKLTFARRTLCPFLRPFFLTPEDEHRVRVVASRETNGRE